MTGTFDHRTYDVSLTGCYVFVPTQRKLTGIYAISGDYRSVADGDHAACLYVGSAADIRRRTMGDHFPQLRGGYHPNAKLQNAWTAHGGEAFTVFVLEECPRDSLLQREQQWMDFYKAQHGNEVLYNIAPEAGRPLVTEEDRYKAALRGKERWTGAGNPMAGSQRFGEKNPFHGRRHSEETRARLSEIARERLKDPANAPWTGKHLPEAMRENLRRLRTGTTLSPETKAKIGARFRGRPNVKNRRGAVRQLDMEGNEIRVWECAAIAAKELGIDAGCIGRCADGKLDHKGRHCLSVGGFRWERIVTPKTPPPS